MPRKLVRPFIAIPLVAIALAMGASALRAEQKCPALSAVQWWDETNHQKMTSYVNARHGGDWDAYIVRWQSHLTKVQGIYNRGGAVASKKLGVRIEGRKLYEYIAAVEQRLTITQCLAEQEMAREAKRLEDMESASGGDDPLPDTIR